MRTRRESTKGRDQVDQGSVGPVVLLSVVLVLRVSGKEFRDERRMARDRARWRQEDRFVNRELIPDHWSLTLSERSEDDGDFKGEEDGEGPVAG